MKEFKEKLIGRLEARKKIILSHKIIDAEDESMIFAYNETINIVNELAEEYINTSTDTSSGWIACRERLPEKDMWCLATFESGNVDKIQYLVTNNWGWNGMRGDNKVIAWMPLPAPYKEGE